MSRPDYQKRIEERIVSLPDGNAFITSDFLDIADTQVVNKALSRMAETGSIRRILRGVYDRPRYSELLQEWAAPKMEEAAKAIARNFGWTIVPCGDTGHIGAIRSEKQIWNSSTRQIGILTGSRRSPHW